MMVDMWLCGVELIRCVWMFGMEGVFNNAITQTMHSDKIASQRQSSPLAACLCARRPNVICSALIPVNFGIHLPY